MNTPYHSKALPQGTILREWELEQVLGVGGFGIVYRGRGVHFNETVAIKEYFPGAISDRTDGTTVTPTDSSSEEIYALGLEKFVEEAKILWNLSKPDRHPNVVSVRSLFTIHGTAYMVMDFESGLSLSQLLKEGRRFDEESLLALIKPVAEGLDRAHRAGVIHRDIKPANILVDDRGRPVLIDFGSARFDSGQATSTKVTFYTPPYAALEQYVKTYQQGPWTDIYALGVTLYQCVTGEKPPEVLERLHGGLGETLSAKPRPGFSRAFCRAVDAAMAIRPSDRPQSIPQWLAMFDEPDAPVDDEATRIGGFAPQGEATVAAPMMAADPYPPAAPAAVAAAPAPAPAARKPSWILPAGIAGAVVIAAGVGVVALKPHGGAPAAPKAAATTVAAAPVAAVAAPAAPGSTVDVKAVGDAAAGLIADAKHQSRPASEVASLNDSQSKIAAVIAQIQAAGAGDKTALVTQLNGLGADMARHETSALSRAAAGQAREVQQTLSGASLPADAKAALTQVTQSKAQLDSATSGAAQTGDAAAAIGAARHALTAFAAFSTAYSGATKFFAPVKRAEVVAEAGQARTLSGEVITFASAAKPGLFASSARKTAYKTLQDNAAKARTQAAQLEQLSGSVASMTDLGQIETAMTQVRSVKSDLSSLREASAAAAQASQKN